MEFIKPKVLPQTENKDKRYVFTFPEKDISNKFDVPQDKQKLLIDETRGLVSGKKVNEMGQHEKTLWLWSIIQTLNTLLKTKK